MYTLLKVQKMLPVHLVVIFNCTYIYIYIVTLLVYVLLESFSKSLFIKHKGTWR